MANESTADPLNLTVIVAEYAEEGRFSAYISQFPIPIAEGPTEEKAIENLKEIVRNALNNMSVLHSY